MMKHIFIFRHIECEGPGLLLDILNEHSLPVKIICVDKGEPVPDSLDNILGLVFMGGPMSVNDPLDWIQAELALIKKAQMGDIPVLGHCLGGQLISKALGGKVVKNKVKEVGWFRVKTVPGETGRSWLEDLPASFYAFHLHGETFTIPAQAQLLLSSKYCQNQAFVTGNNILALQCHIELNDTMLHEWVNVYQEDLNSPSGSVQSRDEILSLTEIGIKESRDDAKTIYEKWITTIKY